MSAREHVLQFAALVARWGLRAGISIHTGRTGTGHQSLRGGQFLRLSGEGFASTASSSRRSSQLAQPYREPNAGELQLFT